MRGRWLVTLAASGVVLGSVACGNAAAPVSLDAAAATAAAGTTAAAASATASATAAATASAPATAAASPLAGTWQAASDGSSFVGYRIDEELGGVGAVTAVGRTTAVTGTLAFSGSAVTAVDIKADVTQLKSDQSRRDNALRQQALETAKFPEARFELTKPIAVAGEVIEGRTLKADATGNLTIHGVTREVTIPLEGKYAGGKLTVVGAMPIVLADYGMEKPRAALVLSVADRGTLEIQVVFTRG